MGKAPKLLAGALHPSKALCRVGLRAASLPEPFLWHVQASHGMLTFLYFYLTDQADLPRENCLFKTLQKCFTGSVGSSWRTACTHPHAPPGFQAVAFQRSVFPVRVSPLTPVPRGCLCCCVRLAEPVPPGCPSLLLSLFSKYRASPSTPISK